MADSFNGDPLEELRSLDSMLASEVERLNTLYKAQKDGIASSSDAEVIPVDYEDMIAMITDIRRTMNYGIEPITVDSLDEQRETLNNKNQEK